jgi:hypothetical protein
MVFRLTLPDASINNVNNLGFPGQCKLAWGTGAGPLPALILEQVTISISPCLEECQGLDRVRWDYSMDQLSPTITGSTRRVTAFAARWVVSATNQPLFPPLPLNTVTSVFQPPSNFLLDVPAQPGLSLLFEVTKPAREALNTVFVSLALENVSSGSFILECGTPAGWVQLTDFNTVGNVQPPTLVGQTTAMCRITFSQTATGRILLRFLELNLIPCPP